MGLIEHGLSCQQPYFCITSTAIKDPDIVIKSISVKDVGPQAEKEVTRNDRTSDMRARSNF